MRTRPPTHKSGGHPGPLGERVSNAKGAIRALPLWTDYADSEALFPGPFHKTPEVYDQLCKKLRRAHESMPIQQTERASLGLPFSNSPSNPR